MINHERRNTQLDTHSPAIVNPTAALLNGLDISARVEVKVDLNPTDIICLQEIRAREIKANLDYYFPNPPPPQEPHLVKPPELKSRIIFNGEPQTVVEFLGHGAHGTVYRAQDRNHCEFSFKDCSYIVHRRSGGFAACSQLAVIHDKLGIPTIADPANRDQDTEGLIYRSKYVHGVELTFMQYDGAALKRLIWSPGLIEKLKTATETWRNMINSKRKKCTLSLGPELQSCFSTLGLSGNVVLEFATGKLFLIDAK